MNALTKPFTLVFALVVLLILVPAGYAIVSGDLMHIAGYLKDNMGSPVAGVDVTGDDYVGDVYPAKTDANGYYSIDIKAEGNYQVSVSCSQLSALGYDCVNPGAVTLTSGSAQLDFIAYPASPLLITNTFLPEGTVGAVYKTQLGVKGGRAPYKWQLTPDSTNSPAGLVLNSRGLLSGKPRTNSVSTINVQVTDSNFIVTNKVLYLTINPGPSLASPSPDSKAK